MKDNINIAIKEILFNKILNATIDQIQALISQHLSPGSTREFLLWILTDSNPDRETYLQVTGIKKIVELSSMLLHNLLDNSTLQRVLIYLGSLNAFFFFEVFSDNLSSGINFSNRKTAQGCILKLFNMTVKRKLLGQEEPAFDLLMPHNSLINSISIIEKSLAAEQLMRLLAKFSCTQIKDTLGDLKKDTLSYLVLNIESCIRLKKIFVENKMLPFFIDNLIARYETGNLLLKLNRNDPKRLLKYGQATILVDPTLLYLTSTIHHFTINTPLKTKTIRLILNAAKLAASLVRINNDLGTRLLMSSPTERAILKGGLLDAYQAQLKVSKLSFLQFLESLEEKESALVLTRILKDLKQGEFNICLEPLGNTNTKKFEIYFFKNIEYFSRVYQFKKNKLFEVLNELDFCFKSNIISLPILRMVTFHEDLYKNNYKDKSGEFAI